MIAPIKFIVAAMMIAVRGGKALVETEVAIAFAASRKPLIKSNVRAKMTTSTVSIMIVFIVSAHLLITRYA
ncbi:hypothetical protein D3C79_987530 [compost metagenome]